MTPKMEKDRKTPLLLVLLHVVQVCTYQPHECPQHQDKDLTCYNDFNHTITCVWNSTYGFNHKDTACTLNAKYSHIEYSSDYSASCDLKPIDVHRPAMKTGSLIFDTEYQFTEGDQLTIEASCNTGEHKVISYLPHCHVKVNPGKPVINNSTISWSFKHGAIEYFNYEVQWKRQDQPWGNTSEKMGEKKMLELEEDWLIQGETYQARYRMQVDSGFQGPWSDWSPTVSWVSPIGTPKQPTEGAEDVWQKILGGVAVVVLFLVVVLFKMDKVKWVYIVKQIRGPPIPNPAKFFPQDGNFQDWLTPHFPSESFHSFLKPMEIVSVEVTSSVEDVSPWMPDVNEIKDNSILQSNSSSFSNPSYSRLCSPVPPVSSLTSGNLEACAADTPYGPVGSQECSSEVDGDEVREKELLSDGHSTGESLQVISEDKKAEELQFEWLRHQSLDSGMSSCEEVSEESLEADSVAVTDAHEENKTEGWIKADFQKLFGSGGGVLGRGSVLVCCDYESVHMRTDSPELPSLDSAVSSGGEEQVEDTATASSRFLFPPHPSTDKTCSSLPSTLLPFDFTGSGLSSGQILEKMALMASEMTVEPSGDDYMPLRQEQS